MHHPKQRFARTYHDIISKNAMETAKHVRVGIQHGHGVSKSANGAVAASHG